MSMSKKDFIALADAVRGLLDCAEMHIEEGEYYVWVDGIAEHFADFCARQNPAFKRERWLGYLRGECGPNGGRRKST